MKKDRVKDAFLELLRKIPIVQIACETVGVSRKSVYAWRKADPKFHRDMDEALAEGEDRINDMTESQLLSLIKEKHWPAISYWLSRRNPRFRNRVDVHTVSDSIDDVLTPEQEAIVRMALSIGHINPDQIV